ncbi:MAG: nitroreductase family protein [Candidatus Hodarchaeota archaeon]
MSIIGINYDKCSNCNLCLTTCLLYRKDKDKNKVILVDNPKFQCNLCGQCIARCPEDAILYEGIGEAFTYEGIEKPETITSYDTIYKFLSANRSTRLYKKKKVPPDTLKKVFEAMSRAPTADNKRLERFSILSDQDKMKTLNDAVLEAIYSIPERSERFGELFRLTSRVFQSPVYFDAPHVIFVDSPEDYPEDSEMQANNIGIIITYGRLAAQTLGLGTCWNGWTQIAIRFNPKIKELANIRGDIMGAFTIGYPAIRFKRSPPRYLKPIDGLE